MHYFSCIFKLQGKILCIMKTNQWSAWEHILNMSKSWTYPPVVIYLNHDWVIFLKLINYSCSSYPSRASYSGQVHEFRNPIKNELKTLPCLKAMFEIISNTDANFLNLHIDKATETRGDKQLFNHTFYETNFRPKLFTRAKNFFFIPLVHWTSNIQISVVRKLNSLVQKKLLKWITKYH